MKIRERGVLACALGIAMLGGAACSSGRLNGQRPIGGSSSKTRQHPEKLGEDQAERLAMGDERALLALFDWIPARARNTDTAGLLRPLPRTRKPANKADGSRKRPSKRPLQSAEQQFKDMLRTIDRALRKIRFGKAGGKSSGIASYELGSYIAKADYEESLAANGSRGHRKHRNGLRAKHHRHWDAHHRRQSASAGFVRSVATDEPAGNPSFEHVKDTFDFSPDASEAQDPYNEYLRRLADLRLLEPVGCNLLDGDDGLGGDTRALLSITEKARGRRAPAKAAIPIGVLAGEMDDGIVAAPTSPQEDTTGVFSAHMYTRLGTILGDTNDTRTGNERHGFFSARLRKMQRLFASKALGVWIRPAAAMALGTIFTMSIYALYGLLCLLFGDSIRGDEPSSRRESSTRDSRRSCMCESENPAQLKGTA